MTYKIAQNEIFDLIKAKYPFLYIVTEDETPVVKTFTRIADEFLPEYDYNVFTWNYPMGFFCEHGEDVTRGHGKKDQILKREEHSLKPLSERVDNLFDFIVNYEGNAMFIIHDFDYIFNEFKESALGLKDVVQTITMPVGNKSVKRYLISKTKYTKHIIVTSPNQVIPRELDKIVNVVYFGMPGKEEIENIVLDIKERNPENSSLNESDINRIVQSAIGLTESEIINALYKSMVSNDGIMSAKDVSELKEQIIRKGGILEYMTPKVGVNDVGGLDNLMNWIKMRRIAFDEKIRVQRNLSYPKGLLMTGVQGCGKSHSVKAIAQFLEMSLIKFNIGNIKGMYVGESEANMRKAIKLAEAVAPCVLWIDEIEKAFPDPRNINTHEVSKGLLGDFLTWTQEKTSPVFVVATANNIDSLPPELLRKGRFDEIFFIDLPAENEREQILKIHLEKRKVDVNHIDLKLVSEKTDGFSGAEIEALVEEANFQSAILNSDLNTEHLLAQVEQTSPMSKIRAKDLSFMRNWANSNQVRKAN